MPRIPPRGIVRRMVTGDRAPPESLSGAGVVPRKLWLVTLLAGSALWLAAAVAIVLTKNTILAPNLILLGTFLVPVCTVLFILSRPRPTTYLSVQSIVLGFLAGGTAGVMLTGTVEIYILPDAVFTNTIIGTVEEGGKALIVLGVASMVRMRIPRDGMVLGATIGAGFAAFESAGYALGEMIREAPTHPVLRVLETQAFRAVFAPFGHITWTALMGGALFASAWWTGRFRIDRRVVATFVGVVALHAAWDASYGFGIDVTRWLGGAGFTLRWPNTAAWAAEPTGAELIRFQVVYDGMLVICAAVGYYWAYRCWRTYAPDRWARTHPRDEAEPAGTVAAR